MKKLLILSIIIGLFSGCATQTLTPNSSPLAVVKKVANLATDLTTTAANLNAAVKSGALPATDPAVTCANDALVKTGLAAPAVPDNSFQVTNAGPVSAGSIAYIKLAMAKAKPPFVISPQCLQMLGQFQVDGLNAIANPRDAIVTTIEAALQ